MIHRGRLKARTQQPHAFVEIGPYRAVSEARERRDLRPGHAFNEPEHQRITVLRWQRLELREHVLRVELRVDGCLLGHESRWERYVARLGAPPHPGSVARDGGEPRPECLGIAELMQLLPRTEEDILRGIGCVLGIEGAE